MASQSDEYDLFVIGAGSGGVRTARVAAACGARVAIAEERHFGGTCVNIGCVPKKLMVYASEYHENFSLAQSFGWQFAEQPSHDWSRMIAAKDTEIARLNEVYHKLLRESGVTIFTDRARIDAPDQVSVGTKRISARYIVIATGGRPVRPDLPGAEFGLVSDDMFYLTHCPKQAVVVGGGYIAVEFACILNGLGCETTLVYRGRQLLRKFDHELGENLAKAMVNQGIRLAFETDCVKLERPGGADSTVLHLTDGSSAPVDVVLFATGRRPNTDDLGEQATALRRGKNGAIKVNEKYQSSVETIFAIGDVTDRLNLTPVAIHEGMRLARYLFGSPLPALDYETVPSAIFSQPAIASVGLSEQDARARFGAIRVYATRFRPMHHALARSEARVFLKLIVRDDDDRVVGAHMMGDHAAEIMQGIAVAISAGATKAIFDTTVGIHPSLAEEFVTMREPRADTSLSS